MSCYDDILHYILSIGDFDIKMRCIIQEDRLTELSKHPDNVHLNTGVDFLAFGHGKLLWFIRPIHSPVQGFPFLVLVLQVILQEQPGKQDVDLLFGQPPTNTHAGPNGEGYGGELVSETARSVPQPALRYKLRRSGKVFLHLARLLHADEYLRSGSDVVALKGYVSLGSTSNY